MDGENAASIVKGSKRAYVLRSQSKISSSCFPAVGTVMQK
jgi:hypothetical protein